MPSINLDKFSFDAVSPIFDRKEIRTFFAIITAISITAIVFCVKSFIKGINERQSNSTKNNLGKKSTKENEDKDEKALATKDQPKLQHTSNSIEDVVEPLPEILTSKGGSINSTPEEILVIEEEPKPQATKIIVEATIEEPILRKSTFTQKPIIKNKPSSEKDNTEQDKLIAEEDLIIQEDPSNPITIIYSDPDEKLNDTSSYFHEPTYDEADIYEPLNPILELSDVNDADIYKPSFSLSNKKKDNDKEDPKENPKEDEEAFIQAKKVVSGSVYGRLKKVDKKKLYSELADKCVKLTKKACSFERQINKAKIEVKEFILNVDEIYNSEIEITRSCLKTNRIHLFSDRLRRERSRNNASKIKPLLMRCIDMTSNLNKIKYYSDKFEQECRVALLLLDDKSDKYKDLIKIYRNNSKTANRLNKSLEAKKIPLDKMANKYFVTVKG